MSSRVHLLAPSGSCDLSGTLRDFKKFTSRKIIKAIMSNEYESMKEWIASDRCPYELGCLVKIILRAATSPSNPALSALLYTFCILVHFLQSCALSALSAPSSSSLVPLCLLDSSSMPPRISRPIEEDPRRQ